MEQAQSTNVEWYYVGHFGQLGPLTFEQMEELVHDGVIERDTYVWHSGLPQWDRAISVPALGAMFAASNPYNVAPPPPPMSGPPPSPLKTAPPSISVSSPYGAPAPALPLSYEALIAPGSVPASDRSRVLGGVLQLVPGVGRIYLGYSALGVLQLLLTVCGGLGFIWSWIDGLIILAGQVRYDGYGRRLAD